MASQDTPCKPAIARTAAAPPDAGAPSIAIVIAAFSRPRALERLLFSLSRADYEGCPRIPLIISIDNGGSDAVRRCAEAFPWAHGEKTLIVHQENIGLKRHILSCGGLTEQYQNVIVLEDDLFVSPGFYRYARQALDFYRQDGRIAGISLYSHDYNELAQLPFRPLEDGHDNYFMRVPSSWGQLWTKNQWRGFLRFYESDESALNASDKLSDIIITQWPEASWKKYFYKYLLVKDKYFVYPRASHTTNFGDAGTSFSAVSDAYQVSLALAGRPPSFSRLEQSLAKYDAYFEILPEIIKTFNPRLAEYDFDCDLYGTREIHKTGRKFLLSAKDCARPVSSFSVSMTPHELNVCFGIAGGYFHLAETAHFKPMAPYKSAGHGYYSKIHPVNIPQIQSDSFNAGVSTVRKSASYRLGHILLYPAKLVKNLLPGLFK